MSERKIADSVRLNLFLAQVGVASRRGCDEIIAAGRVRVDGKPVRSAGFRVTPGVQSIAVDGKPIDRPSRALVLLLHKPPGVVSTVSDPQGRLTVLDLCKRYARNRRLFPVGRLDVNTTGALLITNDGLLCYRLTHPRFGVPRSYVARVRGRLTDRGLQRMRRMATAPGGAGTVEVVKELGKVTVLRIKLYEGRNRQVRRLCEAVGLRVVKLKRVSFGPISIRKLPEGAVRPLEKGELDRLKKTIGGSD
jgi:23S rRNA pseudouridine2605 synthase